MDKTVKCPCGNIVKKGAPKLIEIAKVCDCDNGCKYCKECPKCKKRLIIT